MEEYLEFELPQEQAGFRRGRETRDGIANLPLIMEKAKEMQRDLFVYVLSDGSKAFSQLIVSCLFPIVTAVEF